MLSLASNHSGLALAVVSSNTSQTQANFWSDDSIYRHKKTAKKSEGIVEACPEAL